MSIQVTIASSATHALTLAKRMFQSMYTSTHADGIAAFTEKRKAQFTGR